MRSILFVCMGNICRSPTAEAIMRYKVNERGLSIDIDSAGTIGYHSGSSPDHRAVSAGSRRGYSFDGIQARQVEDDDFQRFDLILAADQDNLHDLRARCPEPLRHKLHLMLDFGSKEYDEVPDPYYGGSRGFELVLDLIEQACDGVLERHS